MHTWFLVTSGNGVLATVPLEQHHPYRKTRSKYLEIHLFKTNESYRYWKAQTWVRHGCEWVDFQSILTKILCSNTENCKQNSPSQAFPRTVKICSQKWWTYGFWYILRDQLHIFFFISNQVAKAWGLKFAEYFLQSRKLKAF